ncbi:tripartite motif-containing protein 2-like [Ptychodera flava]|uniref:tripartite motif-containing protein 2-like n=1 Tax=Ptychodera flava TaxID=63121 RepID=UPI00396A27AB
MACTVAFRREDFDEQFLTCQICYEEYTEPKLLPCCHSFCKVCLCGYVRQRTEFDCPYCREKHLLPETGVDGLPNNFVVNNLRDFFAIQEGETANIVCQSCESTGEAAISWCNDCGHFLCLSCDLAHRTMRFLRSHDVRTLKELQKPGRVTNVMKRKMRCSKHSNQEMMFFCEVCEIPICTACTIIDHNPNVRPTAGGGNVETHRPVDLEGALEGHRLELRRLVRQVRVQEKGLEISRKTIGTEINSLSARKQLVDEKIDKLFDELVAQANKRREVIRSQLRSTYDVKYGRLKSQKNELELHLGNIKSVCEFTEQAIRHGSGAEMMAVKKLVRERLHDLSLRSPLRTILEENAHMDLHVKENNLAEVGKAVAKLGGIVSSTTLPNLCHMKETAQGIFVISTYDYNGRPRKTGGDPIEIRLLESPIADSCVAVSCKDQKNGSYVLKFCLDDDHASSCRLGNGQQVKVTFGISIFGREIDGSPFRNRSVKLHSLRHCSCQPEREAISNNDPDHEVEKSDENMLV